MERPPTPPPLTGLGAADRGGYTPDPYPGIGRDACVSPVELDGAAATPVATANATRAAVAARAAGVVVWVAGVGVVRLRFNADPISG